MAMAIPIIMIVGAAMAAGNAARQGKAAKAAGEFNAQVARENAQVAKYQTTQTVKQFDREQYMRLGAIRAAQGKAGGEANEGSVLDILADTGAQGEIERQDILYRGALAERGYRNTATLDEWGGENAEQAGRMQAGSELLQGAGRAYGGMNRVR